MHVLDYVNLMKCDGCFDVNCLNIMRVLRKESDSYLYHACASTLIPLMEVHSANFSNITIHF